MVSASVGALGKERAGYIETFQANPGKLVKVTNPSYCRARARAWEGPGFSVAQAASVSKHLPDAKQTETLRHQPTQVHLPRRGRPPGSSWASLGQRPVSTVKAWLPFSHHPKRARLCLTPVCQTLCFCTEFEMLSCSVSPRVGQELGYRSDSPVGCGQDDQCPERVGQDMALCLQLQAPHTDSVFF